MTAPRLGNAPVSYGVFGSTVGGASPEQLLAGIAAAGYDGSELGPPGFFGTVEQTVEAFARNGLTAIAAYCPVHFSADDETVAHDLDLVEQTCRELAAAGSKVAVLADEGSDLLLANPARPWDDRSLALADDGWARLAQGVRRAVDLAAGYGLTCAFHPHISTYVESPWEVERVLELTDVALTLDVGHLRLAGGDPAACARAWAGRIAHVHVKDVDPAVLEAAKRLRRSDFDTWWAEVSVPLGTGDVDLPAVFDVLLRHGYGGWWVVEQDSAPTTPQDYPAVAAQQAANRVWLAEQLAVAQAGLAAPGTAADPGGQAG
jgi:inosose dehydratase